MLKTMRQATYMLEQFYLKNHLPIGDRGSHNVDRHLRRVQAKLIQVAKVVAKRQLGDRSLDAALLDTLYELLGFAVSCAVDVSEAFDALHKRNMNRELTVLDTQCPRRKNARF